MLPILLFLALALVQTMSVMGGNFFVHYAAFAATRSAVVHIPANYAGEEANQYLDGGMKHAMIKRAAVMALLPVAGRMQGGGGGEDVAALQAFYQAYGQTTPPWVTEKMPGRMAYADNATEAVVRRVIVNPDDSITWEDVSFGAFEPKEPIAVRVDHRLRLSLRYVSRFFADGEDEAGERYMNVSAQYQLTNEGLPVSLPPDPELPRRDAETGQTGT